MSKDTGKKTRGAVPDGGSQARFYREASAEAHLSRILKVDLKE